MASSHIGIALTLTAVLSTPIPASGQVPESSEQPAAVSTTPVRSFAPTFPQVFKSLGDDFRGMVSNESFLILGIGGAAAFSVHPLDGRVAGSGWVRSSMMGDALGPGKVAGGMVVQSSAAFAAYVLGRATGSPRLATLGAELTRAQIVAQGVTQTIKLSTQRTRPDGTALSFPSGHSAATFATATVLQRELGWKAGVPAYAAAAWVAASRVQAERHFLSDVVAGATVGILAGRAVTVGSNKTRFSLAPTAVPGGVALNFVRVKK